MVAGTAALGLKQHRGFFWVTTAAFWDRSEDAFPTPPQHVEPAFQPPFFPNFSPFLVIPFPANAQKGFSSKRPWQNTYL